jgi:hypothetical protein
MQVPFHASRPHFPFRQWPWEARSGSHEPCSIRIASITRRALSITIDGIASLNVGPRRFNFGAHLRDKVPMRKLRYCLVDVEGYLGAIKLNQLLLACSAKYISARFIAHASIAGSFSIVHSDQFGRMFIAQLNLRAGR